MAVRPQMSLAPAHVWRREELARPASRRATSPFRLLTRALPAVLAVDCVLVAAAFALAARFSLHALPFSQAVGLLAPASLAVFVGMAAAFVFLAFGLGLHRSANWIAAEQPLRLAASAAGWSLIGALVITVWFALDSPEPAARAFAVLAVVLSILGLVATPLSARLVVVLAAGVQRSRRALVVGAGAEGLRISAQIDWDQRHRLEVVGLAQFGSAAPTGGQSAPGRPRFHIHDCEEVPGLAAALAADEVILCAGELTRKEAASLAGCLASDNITTRVTQSLGEMFISGAPVQWPGSIPLLKIGGPPIGRVGQSLKRAADLVIATLGLLALLPLMLITTLAVKLSSPGPVLHFQTRVGKNGRRFEMYKFRSMVVAADDTRYRRYVASLVTHGDAAGFDENGRPIYKIVDDPRVTPVGRLIRRMSIDELPQLINVIKGEMSLVGPRPPLPFEYELYEGWQKRRLEVTPGMTGLWQVSGRNLLSFEDMVLLDLYYGSNWRFLLDLDLIWRTIPEVLHARGAR